jgi:hypothetical protein
MNVKVSQVIDDQAVRDSFRTVSTNVRHSRRHVLNFP